MAMCVSSPINMNGFSPPSDAAGPIPETCDSLLRTASCGWLVSTAWASGPTTATAGTNLRLPVIMYSVYTYDQCDYVKT